MEINIEQETLTKAIGHVLGVVDKRGSLPILSHCLLQTGGNGVFISATDLEIGFRGFYPAKVTKPGTLTVQADFFNKLIKDLPKGPLALVGTDNASLKIQTGDSNYQLYALSGEQFPNLPEAAQANRVEVESPLLREMISKTIFSAVGDNRDLPSNLSGVFWEQVSFPKDGPELEYRLRLISTDGHRLTFMERPFSGSEQIDLDEGFLVPCKGMREICRFLGGHEKVVLGLGEKTLTVQAADKHLSVRLLDRTFPDYRRIIPEGFDFRFSINRRELNDTLKRMGQLSSERFKGVIFNLTADSLEVNFANAEVGEGQELLPVILEEGEGSRLPLKMGFNARYLMEPLQAISSDTVSLEINDRNHPCRLMGKDDPNYFNLIMPMSD
ncbi:MAG: DNA polymerase III subunit beta [Desulfobaccales bacterium]